MTDQNNKPKSKSRRKFLIRGGLGTLGVLALGTYVFRNPLRRKVLGISETLVVPYSGSGTEANLWFEITKGNKILLHSPKVEMGQGTFTGLAQIAANEMEVDIDMMEVTTAETQTGIIDGMSTGGSLSIAQLYQPLREMAATMRVMMKSEAAKQLGADITSIKSSGGIFSSGGKQLSFAEVAENITEWKIPDTPNLKPISEYKYIGKPIKRIDQIAKIKGDPIFGMDATMPNMLYATVIRPEHVGAKLKSADTTVAESMTGIVQIIKR